MNVLRSRMYLVAAAATAMMVSGCTNPSEPSADNGTHAPSEVNSATDTVMSATPDLLEFYTGDDAILATSTNAGDSIDVSPFSPTTGRIAVYSDCVGSGRMTVAIGDVAESSHDCRESSDDPAHVDELDIDPSGRFSIAVTTDNQQPWNVTVVALPPL